MNNYLALYMSIHYWEVEIMIKWYFYGFCLFCWSLGRFYLFLIVFCCFCCFRWFWFPLPVPRTPQTVRWMAMPKAGETNKNNKSNKKNQKTTKPTQWPTKQTKPMKKYRFTGIYCFHLYLLVLLASGSVLLLFSLVFVAFLAVVCFCCSSEYICNSLYNT